LLIFDAEVVQEIKMYDRRKSYRSKT